MDAHTKKILWVLLAFVVLVPVAIVLYSQVKNADEVRTSNATMRSSKPTTTFAPEGSADMAEQASASAFQTKNFDGISISVPKTWRVIGENDTRSLNTNAEALGESLGIAAEQGNNTILWAANAHDDENVTRATMRLSVRMAATVGQAELREAATAQLQEEVEREIMSAAEETAVAMRKIPSTAYYNITGVGLRDNGTIVCT